MSGETKALVITGIGTAVLLVGAVIFLSNSDSTGSSTQPADAKMLVRDNSNKIATPSAKVTLVEFGDYQCPSCEAAHPTVNKLLADYAGKINFVFRHYPFPQHKNAMIAAEAAEAAGEQGKYWEMHDKLYDHQNDWAESGSPLGIFLAYAQELELDEEKFKAAVESEKFRDKILSDQGDGNSLGVNATPTFFINGQKSVGVLSYDDFKKKIDQAAEKAK